MSQTVLHEYAERLDHILNRQPRQLSFQTPLELPRDLPLALGKRRLVPRLAPARQTLHARRLQHHNHRRQPQRRGLPRPHPMFVQMDVATPTTPAPQRLTRHRHQHKQRPALPLSSVLDSIPLQPHRQIQCQRGHAATSSG